MKDIAGDYLPNLQSSPLGDGKGARGGRNGTMKKQNQAIS